MREQELLDGGYRKYEGKDIDVFFNLDTCIHSGVCVKSNTAVFNLKQRPWIKVDQAPSDEVASIIDRCPSGALQYIKR